MSTPINPLPETMGPVRIGIDIARTGKDIAAMGIHGYPLEGATEAYVKLASSMHEFKQPALADAYDDLERLGLLKPVGVGYLDEIPGLKNQLHPTSHVPIMLRDKSGHYYLRKLSRLQRKAFIKANRKDMPLVPQTDWLGSSFLDMEDFLGSSFVWEQSEQGYVFWDKLANLARWSTKSK